MRMLRTPLALALVLVPTALRAQTASDDATGPTPPETPAGEQTPAPEANPDVVDPVTQDPPDSTPSPSALEPGPTAPATATGSASTGGGVGAIVQMGDSEGASSTRGASGSGGVGSYGGPQTTSDDEWKFGFNGYFRAPTRVGIGERINAKTDQSKTTLSAPQIPNDQYLDWQYTKSVQRSWLEAFFSYGNNWVKGVFAIQAFRFTDSTFPDPEAQFGVGQAWVELTPDMSSIDENMRLNAKVGSFWGRYGGAGQYDAGAYDTFIIGRTHVTGEAVRLEYDYNDMVFFFEEGFGTKQPNPNVFQSTKFTLLAHGHAGFNWDQFLNVGLHVMHAWTQEPDHDCQSREEETAFYNNNQPGNAAEAQRLMVLYAEGPVGACKHETSADDRVLPGGALVRRSDTPDGSMTVVGFDAVLTPGLLGRIFFGASRIIAEHAVNVDSAIEVIHANGGGFFKMGVTHQYLVGRARWDDSETWARGGNGTIDTIEGQWDLSLSSVIGADTFGQQQLDLQAFFMLNLINSDDDPLQDGISKLKYGAELTYSPLSWFGIGLRGDRVNPRSDIPEQSFTVLRPRLIFRSDFGTHEEIEIGYARYIYAQRECGNDWLACVQPPNATVGPDGFGTRPGINASKTLRGAPVDVESELGPYQSGINGWDPPHEQAFYISASIWW